MCITVIIACHIYLHPSSYPLWSRVDRLYSLISLGLFKLKKKKTSFWYELAFFPGDFSANPSKSRGYDMWPTAGCELFRLPPGRFDDEPLRFIRKNMGFFILRLVVYFLISHIAIFAVLFVNSQYFQICSFELGKYPFWCMLCNIMQYKVVVFWRTSAPETNWLILQLKEPQWRCCWYFFHIAVGWGEKRWENCHLIVGANATGLKKTASGSDFESYPIS